MIFLVRFRGSFSVIPVNVLELRPSLPLELSALISDFRSLRLSFGASVQLGLEARSYDRGRYAPQVEHGELHFHRLLAESMRQSTRGTRAS